MPNAILHNWLWANDYSRELWGLLAFAYICLTIHMYYALNLTDLSTLSPIVPRLANFMGSYLKGQKKVFTRCIFVSTTKGILDENNNRGSQTKSKDNGLVSEESDTFKHSRLYGLRLFPNLTFFLRDLCQNLRERKRQK